MKVANPELIAKLVEDTLNLKDIKTRNRNRQYCQARFIYFKLAKKFCRYSSLDAIGKVVNRDHATVINGLNRYDMEAKYDTYMNDVYDHIYNKLDSNYVKPGRGERVDLTLEYLLNRLELLESQLNKFTKWKN